MHAPDPASIRTACTMPDWKKFNDPFQILFEDYVRIQAEKEDKYHAVRDAGARFGHINRVDPRWVEHSAAPARACGCSR